MYISESSFPNGTYYARTVNYAGYPDRLWDGLSCEGECDVTAGTPIVISGGADATGIDFNLSWEIAIEDATVTEGDSGTRFLTFTVTVPQASSPAAPSSSSDSGRSVAKPDGE
jgi:hypothetical protein